MNENDKRLTLNTLDRDQVDADFLPFLDKINNFSFVVTKQCCVGHMEYKEPFSEGPLGSAGRWGYLQLLAEESLAMWLMEQIDQWPWLWIPCSQLWVEGAMTPGVTEEGSFEITFAWDAQNWPQPAHDILTAIEAFQRRSLADKND